LLGVGEALKREIAGLVLVDQWCLWGFVGFGCSGSGWTGWLRRAFSGKRLMSFLNFGRYAPHPIGVINFRRFDILICA
jgi:hypothetical protein